MAIKFELEGSLRTDLGKGASRRLRHSDNVPAIVYGGGENAISITLDHKKVAAALSHEAFYSHILDLKIANNTEKVILKDVQRHPAKPRIQHLDFLRVRADQSIQMHVPLHFIGESKSPGAKEGGGVFSRLLSDIEITCLPADLPEFIEVDVSNMQLNDAIHLSHLKLPKGVQIPALSHITEEDDSNDLPVITLHPPRITEEPVEEEAVKTTPTETSEAPKTENTPKSSDKGDKKG